MGPGPDRQPGSTQRYFNATAAPTYHFELQGYLSLDGANNGYTDTFSLTVNGTTLLTGAGTQGGGANVLYFNPNNAIVNAHATSYFGGGKASVEIPIALLDGSNTIKFSYAGEAQGLGDEGINTVSVSPCRSRKPMPCCWSARAQGCTSRRKAVKTATVNSADRHRGGPRPPVWCMTRTVSMSDSL